jgi:hypothetical protein
MGALGPYAEHSPGGTKAGRPIRMILCGPCTLRRWASSHHLEKIRYIVPIACSTQNRHTLPPFPTAIQTSRSGPLLPNSSQPDIRRLGRAFFPATHVTGTAFFRSGHWSRATESVTNSMIMEVESEGSLQVRGRSFATPTPTPTRA